MSDQQPEARCILRSPLSPRSTAVTQSPRFGAKPTRTPRRHSCLSPLSSLPALRTPARHTVETSLLVRTETTVPVTRLLDGFSQPALAITMTDSASRTTTQRDDAITSCFSDHAVIIAPPAANAHRAGQWPPTTREGSGAGAASGFVTSRDNTECTPASANHSWSLRHASTLRVASRRARDREHDHVGWRNRSPRFGEFGAAAD